MPCLPARTPLDLHHPTRTALQSAKKRPTIADLLRHPWIQQHAPGGPPSSASAAGAADLHLPLAAVPFQELHRVSLHGAMSCRDLSALVPASGPGMRPGTLASLLTPSLSAGASALAAAASDAGGSAAAVRPTTSFSASRLGLGAAGRPVTPSAASLAALLPASAFDAGSGGSPGAAQPAGPGT